jgi:hypothetical protein
MLKTTYVKVKRHFVTELLETAGNRVSTNRIDFEHLLTFKTTKLLKLL